MWLFKVALVILGLACLSIGPLAVYKSFQTMKSGNFREIKAGIVLLALGVVFLPMGFALFYLTFTF